MKKSYRFGILGIISIGWAIAPLVTPARSACSSASLPTLTGHPRSGNEISALSAKISPDPPISSQKETVPPSPLFPDVEVPPQPGPRNEPFVTIEPRDGVFDVRIANATGVSVFYEALGFSERRSLPSGQVGILRGLSLPVTLVIVREDNGLIELVPESSRAGLLELTVRTTPGLDRIYGVLFIAPDGAAYLR